MNSICYMNGKFQSRNNLFLGAEDLAFTRGYAAYECLRAYGKTLFYFEDHLARLKRTLAELLLPMPAADIESILHALIEKNGMDDLVFRMYVTGSGTFFILVDPPSPPTSEQLKAGVAVMTTPLPRTFPTVKSTNYTSAMVSLKKAASLGFYEALYQDDEGNLLELTKANFFAIVNETLYTAKDHVLYGITRNIVVSLAKELGIPVVQGPISNRSIHKFSGAFLTSTTKELLPITRIDQTPLPQSPLTSLLHKRFIGLRSLSNLTV